MAESTPLTLYYAPRTRSFTALWLLEELGVPYALESFDLNGGRNQEPDYLALNPMGKVPLVVHGQRAISAAPSPIASSFFACAKKAATMPWLIRSATSSSSSTTQLDWQK